jgi:hypothetical protein
MAINIFFALVNATFNKLGEESAQPIALFLGHC